MTERTVDLLGGSPLFDKLTPRLRQTLVQAATTRRLAVGDRLLVTGELNSCLFIVVEGAVDVLLPGVDTPHVQEFVVLVSDVDTDAGKEVAERLRRQVSHRASDDAPACTLSVGVAALRAGETFHALVARADAALFRAKQNGRDRVSS